MLTKVLLAVLVFQGAAFWFDGKPPNNHNNGVKEDLAAKEVKLEASAEAKEMEMSKKVDLMVAVREGQTDKAGSQEDKVGSKEAKVGSKEVPRAVPDALLSREDVNRAVRTTNREEEADNKALREVNAANKEARMVNKVARIVNKDDKISKAALQMEDKTTKEAAERKLIREQHKGYPDHSQVDRLELEAIASPAADLVGLVAAKLNLEARVEAKEELAVKVWAKVVSEASTDLKEELAALEETVSPDKALLEGAKAADLVETSVKARQAVPDDSRKAKENIV
uniref:DUF148 domain-containing protein n=1 Tax=Bursaphelenchus xylophilus TaxID=6326 RepID=A0A1I7SRD2_BURXY